MRHQTTSLSVAPLVGAWIEIARAVTVNKGISVAPLVGAWIEIAGTGAVGTW